MGDDTRADTKRDKEGFKKVKCPKCGKEGAKYIVVHEGSKKSRPVRSNFIAKHKCGFKGRI